MEPAMADKSDNDSSLPPHIKAAFDYLEHVRDLTQQWDATIPVRELTSVEKSVHTAALRALQQYLLGEMDFAETSEPSKPAKRKDGDGTASAPSGCTT
jgi:hypothetical protein